MGFENCLALKSVNLKVARPLKNMRTDPHYASGRAQSRNIGTYSLAKHYANHSSLSVPLNLKLSLFFGIEF